MGFKPQIWVGYFRTLPLIYFLSHSLVNLLECLESSCCEVHFLFGFSFLTWPRIILKHGLVQRRSQSIFCDDKLCRLLRSKAAQTITFPPTWFIVGIRFFGFYKTCLLVLLPNDPIIASSVQSTLYQKSWTLPRRSTVSSWYTTCVDLICATAL